MKTGFKKNTDSISEATEAADASDSEASARPIHPLESIDIRIHQDDSPPGEKVFFLVDCCQNKRIEKITTSATAHRLRSCVGLDPLFLGLHHSSFFFSLIFQKI